MDKIDSNNEIIKLEHKREIEIYRMQREQFMDKMETQHTGYNGNIELNEKLDNNKCLIPGIVFDLKDNPILINNKSIPTIDEILIIYYGHKECKKNSKKDTFKIVKFENEFILLPATSN